VDTTHAPTRDPVAHDLPRQAHKPKKNTRVIFTFTWWTTNLGAGVKKQDQVVFHVAKTQSDTFLKTVNNNNNNNNNNTFMYIVL